MTMSDKTEKVEEAKVNRQWIAPEFTVLTAGATAGGPTTNTEAYNYKSS
jgi:hypothetical protein